LSLIHITIPICGSSLVAEPQAPEEVMGAPDFIEGGFGSTVAGGKYEAEFKPALPSPSEAATSKEPMKPSAPFYQPTVTLKPHGMKPFLDDLCYSILIFFVTRST
jgi:hypothetical protein